MTSATTIQARVEELRRSFDDSFTRPHESAREQPVHILLVGVGGRTYGVRLAEVLELVADRAIVPVPSSADSLLGLAAVRSEVIAVFDLRALLGHAPTPDAPRWLLVTGRHEARVAFGCDAFERDSPVPHSAIHPIETSSPTPFLREVVELGARTVPLISLLALAAAVAGEARDDSTETNEP